MLTTTQKQSLYRDWASQIANSNTRAAFWYLVDIASQLRDFDCHFQADGEEPHFSFCDKLSGEQTFAFVTVAEWLLFYFREPATTSTAFSFASLRGYFPSASQTSDGEWMVRLRTMDDVQRLAHFVGWQESSELH